MVKLHNVSDKAETTGAGVEKVKISENPDNFNERLTYHIFILLL